MNEVVLFTEKIGIFLGECARQACHRLTFAAPFIKRNAIERLIADVAPTVAVTIFTRWSVDEIRAGFSDLSVFDLVRQRNESRLLLNQRLHAKVLLVDHKIAVIGSANITDAALGFSDQPNAEVMAKLQPVPNRLFHFLLQLERNSIPATEQLRQQFEEAAKATPPPWNSPAVHMTGPAVPAPAHFPRFRNPERLFCGYVSVVEFGDHETRAAVLDDLEALMLPDGLDELSFRQRVGAALLDIGIIAALDQFLMQPRYFGEMAEWLKEREAFTTESQEDRKRYLQTLVRWLRHFLPGRYRLEEPNYSELFGRVEGWPN